MNVIGTDGTALWAGAWQAGAVVTLNKNEDNAFFSTSNASMTTLQAEISALKNQVAGIKTIPSREPLFSGTWNHGTSKTIDMKGYSVIAANTYIGPMVLMIYGNGYSGIGGMRYSNANFGVYATLSFTATSGTTRTMSLDIRNSSSGAEIITTIYGLFK